MPHAGAQDVERAVKAARAAFADGPWASMPAAGRERLMHALADAIEARAEELAQIESLDNGKPVGLAQYVDVNGAIGHLRYFAGWPTKIEGGVLPVAAPNMHCYTRREPVGVCAQIIPWNFPLLMAAWKLGPALAAGCTVVLKPAEQTPLSALRIGELALEVGFPPGVLNVLTGDGETGAALVDHPGVDKIAFTGSTAVGREIGAKAGKALKRVTLELGGKSPNIILPDADIDAAIKGSFQAIYFNSGQACNAGSRLFVPAERFDEVMSGLADAAKAAQLGPGLDPGTQLGPLVSAEQHERVLGYIEAGREEGAEVLAGGEAALTDSGGYFVAPTLFATTSDELRISREEIFGPVLVASPYDSLEEVASQGERQRVRPGRGRVDARCLQRPSPGRDAARGHGLHQHLGSGRSVGAVRRLQGLRHRSRAWPRRPRRLPGDKDGLDGVVGSSGGVVGPSVVDRPGRAPVTPGV